MNHDASSQSSLDGDDPDDARRGLRSVLSIAALSAVLGLSVPVYYGLTTVAPSVVTLVPAVVPHGMLGVGLFVTFPGTVLQAKRLDVTREADGVSNYGVDDRWERRNL